MFGLRRKIPPAPAPVTPPGRRPVRHVHLIDTAVASDNLGDEIIGQAARAALMPLFGDCYVTTSAGHDGLGPFGRELVAQADVAILLGTNALSPRDQMRLKRFVWMIRPEDLPVLAGRVVLCGVGANRTFDSVDPAQLALLKQVLSPHYRHSVRDSLGAAILRAAGVEALNTSCPTLWSWRDHDPQVPAGKAPGAVFTLTKHKPDPADAEMLRVLRRLYDRLWFWPQQPRDLGYLDEIGGREGITVLAPNLAAYDRLLASEAVDVVGTRLHGGIRGLSHGRRVLVVAIDNRAAEIGAETGLPVIARSEVATGLETRLAAEWPTRLHLPGQAIDAFLGQFAG